MKKRRKVSDERWATALSAADDGNLRELVRALLVVAVVPDWVRKDLAGEDYDEPPLSGRDRKLLTALRAYHAMPHRPGEKQPERIRRFMAQHPVGVSEAGLRAALDGRGRPAGRLRYR